MFILSLFFSFLFSVDVFGNTLERVLVGDTSNCKTYQVFVEYC